MNILFACGKNVLRKIKGRRNRSSIPSDKGSGYDDLFRSIGIEPHNLDLYHLAFLHRSYYPKDHEGNRLSNERIEFLGDAILSAIVSVFLYETYPEWDEGKLSKRKASVVSRHVNNKVAQELGLCHYLLYRGEIDPYSGDLPGNTLEALIGAIYLDQGFKITEHFVLDHVLPVYRALEKEGDQAINNYKSLLLEWAQRHHFDVHFSNRNKTTPRKGGLFVYAVEINGKVIGIGQSTSIKRAHQEASFNAIQRLREAHIEIIPNDQNSKSEDTDQESFDALGSLDE